MAFEAQDIVWVLRGETNQLDAALERTRGNLFGMGLVLTAVGAGVTAFFASAVESAGEFEQAITNTTAVTGRQGEAFDAARMQLSRLALELGETTVFRASEASSALESLARKGLDPVGASADELRPILDLAAATQVDLTSATDIATSVMMQYQLQFKDLVRIADVFTAATTRSNLTLEKIGRAFPFVGALAAQAKISLEDLTATLGILTNKGIPASIAARGLRRAIAELLSPGKKLRDILDELGLSVEDVNPSVHGLVTVLERLRDRGLSVEDAMEAFQLRAGPVVIALTSVSETGGDTTEDLRKLADELKNVGNEARRVAERQLDTFEGKVILLKSKLEVLRIEIGNSFTPVLGEMADAMGAVVKGYVEWSREHESLSSGINQVVGVSGILVTVLGTLAWSLGLIGFSFNQVVGAGQLLLQLLGTNATGLIGSLFSLTGVATAAAGLFVLAAWPVGKWIGHMQPVQDFLQSLILSFMGVQEQTKEMREQVESEMAVMSNQAVNMSNLQLEIQRLAREGRAQEALEHAEHLRQLALNREQHRLKMVEEEISQIEEVMNRSRRHRMSMTDEEIAHYENLVAQRELHKENMVKLESEEWTERTKIRLDKQSEIAKATADWLDSMVQQKIETDAMIRDLEREQRERENAFRERGLELEREFHAQTLEEERAFYQERLVTVQEFLERRQTASQLATEQMESGIKSHSERLTLLNNSLHRNIFNLSKTFLEDMQELQSADIADRIQRRGEFEERVIEMIRQHQSRVSSLDQRFRMEQQTIEREFRQQDATEVRNMLESIQNMELDSSQKRLANVRDFTIQRVKALVKDKETQRQLLEELETIRSESNARQIENEAQYLINWSEIHIEEEKQRKDFIKRVKADRDSRLEHLRNVRAAEIDIINNTVSRINGLLEQESETQNNLLEVKFTRQQEILQQNRFAHEQYVDALVKAWTRMKEAADTQFSATSNSIAEQSRRGVDALDKAEHTTFTITDRVRAHYLAMATAAKFSTQSIMKRAWNPFIFDYEQKMGLWKSLTEDAKSRLLSWYADISNGVAGSLSDIRDIIDDMVGQSWYVDGMNRFRDTTFDAVQDVASSWGTLADDISDSASDIEDNVEKIREGSGLGPPNLRLLEFAQPDLTQPMPLPSPAPSATGAPDRFIIPPEPEPGPIWDVIQGGRGTGGGTPEVRSDRESGRVPAIIPQLFNQIKRDLFQDEGLLSHIRSSESLALSDLTQFVSPENAKELRNISRQPGSGQKAFFKEFNDLFKKILEGGSGIPKNEQLSGGGGSFSLGSTHPSLLRRAVRDGVREAGVLGT